MNAARADDRCVRTCLQHGVPLVEDTRKDTLVCPKGNHPVRKWGTVERSRFTSAEARYLGATDTEGNPVDEVAPLAKKVVDPLREVRVEEKEKKPGVHERIKYKDAAGNELWLYLRKKTLKVAGARAWHVTWRTEGATSGKKASGIAATAPTEELARTAFASKRKSSWAAGWDEVHAGAGRTETMDPPPPPKPVKR